MRPPDGPRVRATIATMPPASRGRSGGPREGARQGRSWWWAAAVAVTLSLGWAGWATGCSAEPQAQVADGGPDAPLVAPDGGLDLGGSPDTGGDEATSPDALPEGDLGPDGGEDVGADAAPPKNTPPVFAPLPAVTVRMGWSTTLALSDYLNDLQSPREALSIQWTSEHVGLAVQGTPAEPVLYIVGPTDWSGQEVIKLTAADPEGLTDATLLTVTVEEVVPPEPRPDDTCGHVTLSYTPPAQATVQSVLASGTFNGWASTDAGAAVLGDPDGDGVWSVDLVLDPGSYQYKFIVDGDWMADPANPDTVDDGYGGQNSVLAVPACDGTPPAPATCPATFTYGPDDQADQVLLSGSFNGWGATAGAATPLVDPDGDDVFEATIELAPGSYQYKLIVDGTWMTDPANPDTVDDGSGNLNSVRTVEECAP